MQWQPEGQESDRDIEAGIDRRGILAGIAPVLAPGLIGLVDRVADAAPRSGASVTKEARGSAEMTLGPIGNVFYFVEASRFDEAVDWYSARLGRKPVVAGGALAAFDIHGTRLTVHKVDDLNAAGPAGVAAYWTVPDVDAVVAEWTRHGAKAHRGPKTVFTNERLCQLLDPFGNLFGVRQPARYDGGTGAR